MVYPPFPGYLMESLRGGKNGNRPILSTCPERNRYTGRVRFALSNKTKFTLITNNKTILIYSFPLFPFPFLFSKNII